MKGMMDALIAVERTKLGPQGYPVHLVAEERDQNIERIPEAAGRQRSTPRIMIRDHSTL